MSSDSVTVSRRRRRRSLSRPDADESRERPEPRSNRVASVILLVAIAGAPLPFGTRDPTTVAFWCCLLGVGLLFASPRQLRGPHFAMLAGIGLVIAGYAFVLHEQLAAHPWVAQFNPIWAQTSDLLGQAIQPSVSIVRD